MNSKQQSRLKQLTLELKACNERARLQYKERTLAEGYTVNFYEEVKPFADEVQTLADEWKPLAIQWVIEEKPSYVYGIQIKDTYENLTIVAVTAFQTDTKKKRFMEMISSISYVLETMEPQLLGE